MVQGTVVTYACGREGFLQTHEGVTQATLARILARLKRYTFGGEYIEGQQYTPPLYFVPRECLSQQEARALGIHQAEDLYGGIVPLGFASTKVITHPLLHEESSRPPGWSQAFAHEVEGNVLPGFTAFSQHDAETAGLRLLKEGPIRVKHPLAAGGRDQWVVASSQELATVLSSLSPEDLARHGLVLERNLSRVTTLSVGFISFDGMTLAYHGTQRSTRDNAGRTVYGGSELFVVQGDGEALLHLDLPESVRRGIAQALAYDRAATAHYGLIGSRRNYDVAVGVDPQGRPLSGVLEQSWRIGGASGAEVAALLEFRRSQAQPMVHTSCVEAYGEEALPPSGAQVLFHGIDPEVGPLLKYTVVHETA
jgi:hypothetical protein